MQMSIIKYNNICNIFDNNICIICKKRMNKCLDVILHYQITYTNSLKIKIINYAFHDEIIYPNGIVVMKYDYSFTRINMFVGSPYWWCPFSS